MTSADAASLEPLQRLTEREKDCLRRWLSHQTAKEIALDLGISPHAVEKRLKMARLKLGVTTSLDAARLLGRAEGYDPTGPQRADLGKAGHEREAVAIQTVPLPETARTRRLRWFNPVSGVTVMSLMVAALLYLAASAPLADPHAAGEARAAGKITVGGVTVPVRKVDMCEAGVFLDEDFRHKDKDRSGSLEGAEIAALESTDVALRDRALPPAPGDGSQDSAALAKWQSLIDRDRDDRLSQAEYVSYMLPWTLWQGVPEFWPAEGTSHCRSTAATN